MLNQGHGVFYPLSGSGFTARQFDQAQASKATISYAAPLSDLLHVTIEGN